MKTAFVALVLFVTAGGLAVACGQPSEYKITTKRKDDAVEVRAEKDRTLALLAASAGLELPLTDGYFEMALPGAFFEGNPKSITLDWIDFYR